MTNVILGHCCAPSLPSSLVLAPSTIFFRIGKWAIQPAKYLPPRQAQKKRFGTSTRSREAPKSPLLHTTQKPRQRRSFDDNFSKRYSTSPSVSDASSRLSFRLAASSCGKGRKFSRFENTYPFDPTALDPLGLEYGVSLSERRLDRRNSGEDAFFVSKISGKENTIAFGIADGVGGWADKGINPADFSHGLCSQMALAAMRWPSNFVNLTPGKLMYDGYSAVLHDPHIRAGGSTACVGCVNPDGRLQMANLGDSGYLLLRTGRVHHYSYPQTHAFNTPYQLSVVPPKILAQASVFGGGHYIDTPSEADLSENMLQEGDVLILASDGVWDNLNSQDLLGIVKRDMSEKGAWELSAGQGISVANNLESLTRFAPSGGDAQSTLQSGLAASIVAAAKTASLDQKRDGPFAKEIQKHYPQDGWRGGKVDDICVVVLVAVAHNESTGETDFHPSEHDMGEMEVDQMVIDEESKTR